MTAGGVPSRGPPGTEGAGIVRAAWPDTGPARFFPGAARYAFPPPGPGGRVGEPGGGRPDAPASERLLQCAWYDPALRPDSLRTAEGEAVRVESPGVWNLEPGPDFLGAALVLGPERRRLAGGVEVHLRASGWTGHGHAGDPRYAGVRAHVTFFPGRAPAGTLPPGCIEIALQPALAARPGFSFEDIDPAAYPYAARGPLTPCARELAAWHPDDKEALLAAAGEARLLAKAGRMARRIRERGAPQAFYEEFLAALGYRRNKGAARRLAAAVPLDELRGEAGGDGQAAYALLMGVAGLLPDTAPARWDAETRRFVRHLWDAWWKRRRRWADRRLEAGAWTLAGMRPANHPARRLAAAAWLFTRGETPEAVFRRLAARRAPGFARAALAVLTDLPAGYWSHRVAWSGAAGPRATALLGRARAVSILINVVVPFLAADGAGAPAFAAGLLAELPPETDSGLVRATAHTLFGPGHPVSWYRGGLRRQGLVQIFRDFCLNDRSRCAACPFPACLRGAR